MGKSFDNYRIDNKVITASLVLSIVFLAMMAFRYKNTRPCPIVDFSFRTANKFDVAYEKEKVYFSSEVKYDANEWEWDFGDKSPVDKTSGPYVSHEYAASGVYVVRLTINGKCEQVKNISIDKREQTKSKLYLRPSWPPETLVAGREYYFGDSTLGAKTWSWFFDRDDTKRTKQFVKYQFLDTGVYRVILVVNEAQENEKTEMSFRVVAPPQLKSQQVPDYIDRTPKPPPSIPFDPSGGSDDKTVVPVPSPEDYLKTPALGDGSLKAYILDVNGGGGASLKKYLKNQNFDNCSYVFNGKSIKINELGENIKVHAKYGKSLSVKQEVDAKEGFIKMIEITAELERTKGFIGIGKKDRKYPY
jgi:PKD repeat protein